MKLWTRICAVAMLFNSAKAIAGAVVTVYKSCEEYVDYLREHGYLAKTIGHYNSIGIGTKPQTKENLR